MADTKIVRKFEIEPAVDGRVIITQIHLSSGDSDSPYTCYPGVKQVVFENIEKALAHISEIWGE